MRDSARGRRGLACHNRPSVIRKPHARHPAPAFPPLNAERLWSRVETLSRYTLPGQPWTRRASRRCSMRRAPGCARSFRPPALPRGWMPAATWSARAPAATPAQAHRHRLALRHRAERRPLRRHHRRAGGHRGRAHAARARRRAQASLRGHRLPVRGAERLRHFLRRQPRAQRQARRRHAGCPQSRRRNPGAGHCAHRRRPGRADRAAPGRRHRRLHRTAHRTGPGAGSARPAHRRGHQHRRHPPRADHGRGQPDHAGTTPMDIRRDALVGAARIIDGAHRQASAASGKPHYVVATVGRLS